MMEHEKQDFISEWEVRNCKTASAANMSHPAIQPLIKEVYPALTASRIFSSQSMVSIPWSVTASLAFCNDFRILLFFAKSETRIEYFASFLYMIAL